MKASWFRWPGAISIGFHLGCCNNVVFVHFVFLGCLFYGLVTVTQCYTYCILYITSIIDTYSCHLYLFMTLLYDFDLFSSCSSILFYFPGLPSSQRGLGCRKSNGVSSCFLGFAWAFYVLNLWNQRQRRKNLRFSPRFLLKCSTRKATSFLPHGRPSGGSQGPVQVRVRQRQRGRLACAAARWTDRGHPRWQQWWGHGGHGGWGWGWWGGEGYPLVN